VKAVYVILAIPAVSLLVWVSRFMMIALDTLAGGVRWLGIGSPITGWAVLGAVIGAAIGANFGLRRVGRRLRPVSAFGLSTVLVVGLAMAGAQAPALSVEPNGDIDALRPQALFSARVLGSGLNLRAGPAPSARVLQTLTGGSVVDVIEIRLNWMLVRIAGGATNGDGWAYRKYLRRL